MCESVNILSIKVLEVSEILEGLVIIGTKPCPYIKERNSPVGLCVSNLNKSKLKSPATMKFTFLNLPFNVDSITSSVLLNL